MRERRLSLLLALGSLTLFYVLFIGSPAGFGDDELVYPTSEETRGNGYRATRAWLESAGVRVRSWRDRYDKLPTVGDAGRGNLLIVTLPSRDRFRDAEFLPLDRWVRSGNTLLVLAALTDSPDWALRFIGRARADLEALTGLEFEQIDADATDVAAATDEWVATKDADVESDRDLEEEATEEAEGAGVATDDAETELANEAAREAAGAALESFRRASMLDIPLEVRAGHPLSLGVRRLVAKSEAEPRAWSLQLPLDDFALVLATEPTTGEGALFVRQHGEGRVIVVTAATLFANRAIGEADNARLLANIVAYALTPGGAVLFDDLRQGLSANYAPERFLKDPRLYITLGLLLALWLVWVIGSTRLHAPVRTEQVPNEAALVEATGGLLARRVPTAALAQRRLELFTRRVTALPGVGADGAWTWLAGHARIASTDLDRLREWRARAERGASVPLVPLHNLLRKLERQLFHEAKDHST
jgi:hypothetical protein